MTNMQENKITKLSINQTILNNQSRSNQNTVSVNEQAHDKTTVNGSLNHMQNNKDSSSLTPFANNADHFKMQALGYYNTPVNLPGSVLYLRDINKLILNPFAVSYLGLPEDFANRYVEVKEVTNALGKFLTAIILDKISKIQLPVLCFEHANCNLYNCPKKYSMSKRLMIRCPALSNYHSQGGTNKVFFELVARKGKFKGTRFYCNVIGIYDLIPNEKEPKYKLATLTFLISRVSSYLFDRVPQSIEDRGYYDWDILSDKINFNKRYYSVFGYENNDSRVPTNMDNWIKTMMHEADQKHFLKKDLNSDEILNDELGPDSVYHSFYGDLDNDDLSDHQKLNVYAHENYIKQHNFKSYEHFFRFRRADNTFVWTKSVGIVLGQDPKTEEPTRILGVNININRVVDSFEHLRNKVFTDILTGLRNRTYLNTHIASLMQYQCQPLSLIFTDITGLKLYNDYLTHNAGDKLLCMASDLIEASIKHEHELVRVSGDEIVCILPNCNVQTLKEVEQSIQHHLERYNLKAPIRMPVLFSCGSVTIDYRPLLEKQEDIPNKEFLEEIFYKALYKADLRMQENKQKNKQEHYQLIHTYIENTLKRKIMFKDTRLFDSDADMDKLQQKNLSEDNENLALA